MRYFAPNPSVAWIHRLLGFAFTLLAATLGLAGAPAPLQIIDTQLPVGVEGAPYAYFALTAFGGTAPYTFSILAGSLPAGITMDAGGLFQGTPTVLGAFPLTFQVRDAVNATAAKSLTMTISPPATPPQWSPRGLAGGTIRDVEISPDYGNDATLFAIGGSNEINRSTDQGGSWNHIIVNPANPGQPVDGFALSPVFSRLSTANEAVQTIFASTLGGLYKSVDHGDSYSGVGAGLPNGATRIAFSPDYLTDQTLFVAGYQDFVTGATLYRSVDRGLNFTAIALFPELLNVGIGQIVVSPNYTADLTLFLLGANRHDVYRSTNGGASWSVVYTLTGGNYARQIVISPNYATDQTLFVTGDLHIFRSVNGGASFTLQRFWTVGMVSIAMVKRPAQTPLLYYMTYDSPAYMIFMSDDYAATSVPLYGDGVRLPPYGLAVSPLLAGGLPDLYAHGSLGVDLSHDGGFSFSPRDAGLNAYVFNGLAGSGADIVAGGENGWFKSSNTGNGWVRKTFPFTSDTYALYPAISPNYATDETIFMTNTQEVHRSTDGGASFSLVLSVPSAYYYTGFAVAPNFNPLTGVVFAGSEAGGLWRSTDGGRTYALVTGGGTCPLTASSSVSSAAVSPNFATDQTVFITAGPSNATSKLCRSSDGGVTWTLLRAALTYNVSLSPLYNQAAANGTLAKMLIITDGSNFSQLLRSMDGGVTFIPTGSYANAPAHYSPNFSLDGTILVDDYYGTNGILRSDDFGVTFAPLGPADPLGVRIVSGLYLAPGFDGRNTVNSVALAATQGSGVWQSTDGGRTFNPVYGYDTLSAELTGLARGPGDSQSTPILAATADQGIFRSTDGGDTFASFSAGLPADANAKAVAVPTALPASPVTAVVDDEGVPRGLWRYNGSLWTQVPTADTGTFTSFLEFPQPVSGKYLYATRSDGVSLRSSDDGLTWTSQDAAQSDLVNIDFNDQSGPTTLVPQGAAKGPARATGAPDVVTNTASLWSVSQTGGARYSTNSGATWIPAVGSGDYALPSGATFTTVRALGINPVSGSREVVVGTTSGLYRTTDGGLKWRNVSAPGSGLEATSRNFSAFVTSTTPFIPATTDLLTGVTGTLTGGVYLSGDGGEHWSQVNQGYDPANLNITTLIKTSCTGCPVQYYSGTYGSGVYTRTIAVVAAPVITGWCFGPACTSGSACGTAAMSGPEQGGQSFKLCVSNLQNLAVVEFDGAGVNGASCGITAGASGSIFCAAATPPHVPGPAALRIRNPDTRAGYANQNYTYVAGTPRVSNLRVAKSGADAALTWNCASCAAPPARVYRSQNAPFTLNVEQYTGGSGLYTNTGALAASANPTYFWSIE